MQVACVSYLINPQFDCYQLRNPSVGIAINISHAQ